MMIRDIIERPSSSTSASCARSPSPPTSHSNGFPLAQHRSQKQFKATSSFSRTPKQEIDHHDRIRVARTGHPVQAVPAVQAVSSRSAYQSRPAVVGDAHALLKEDSEANWRLVRDMSDAQREEERRELEERFGGNLMKALRTRAMGRSQAMSSADIPSSSTSQIHSSLPDTPGVILSSSALKERYFPDVPTESSKLEWLQSPTASCSTDTSVRFDLTGTALSDADKTDLPSDLGLHHHGTAPDLAGYTLQDILHLARSTVPSQRITMLGVLAKIVATYEFDTGTMKNVEARTACREGKVREKGVELGVEILLSPSRSLGIMRAGIDLLFEALGGSTWWWLDKDLATVPFQQDSGGIANLPFDVLIPRLSQILANKSGFPPRSIQQIIRILRRAAQHSVQLAKTVCPLVSVVAQDHVLRKPWPLEPDNEPSIDCLRLVDDVVTSSRTCALSLVGEDLFQELLKFAIPSTWTSGTECQVLTLEVLQIYRKVGRYGLLASIATSAQDIWRDFGFWASRQITPLPLASSMISVYFDCLAIWMTCATDPHRTTPEHDLTWSQISKRGWADEAILIIRNIGIQRGRIGEISSALGLLVVWVDGTGLNGLRGGEAEKTAVINELRQSELQSVLQQYVDANSTELDDEAIIQMLTIAMRLQRNLSSAPEAKGLLFELDTIQILMSKFLMNPKSVKATASKHDAQLRYELLHLSRASNLIDVDAWSRQAFSLMLEFGPGDETVALDLVDLLLREDWSSTAPDLLNQLSSLTHRDGLQILRPLLQYAILPDVSHVIGPSYPSYLYLKATSTLRQPVERSRPGLPLPLDWVFSPLNELLSSATSSAFSQAPLDWNPNELEIVQATLILAQLNQHPVDRSSTLLNLMKVFMLEHGQQSASTSDSDIFRDSTVSLALSSLLTPITRPTAGQNPRSLGLEDVAKSFLGSDVPFFRFYSDFLALYESISFSHILFAQLLLPPLAMSYPVDYRKLLWAEQSSALRTVRTKISDVPLEQGSIRVFYVPREEDPDV
ncbi:MAG: hypothetical protein TREMPRED_001472, partial [Tremellales sp. Tagirdzhanova-0007]